MKNSEVWVKQTEKGLLKIRHATEQDVYEVAILDRNSGLHSYFSAAAIRSFTRDNQVLVAEAGGKMFAFFIRIRKKHRDLLAKSFVMPEYARLGVYTALLLLSIKNSGKKQFLAFTVQSSRESVLNVFKKILIAELKLSILHSDECTHIIITPAKIALGDFSKKIDEVLIKNGWRPIR